MSCIKCNHNEQLIKRLPNSIDYKYDVQLICINCVRYINGYIEIEKFQKLYDEYQTLKTKYEQIQELCLP